MVKRGTRIARLSVCMTDDEWQKVEQARRDNNNYYSIMFRQAMRLWLFLLREQESGSRVELVRADGTRQRVLIVV